MKSDFEPKFAQPINKAFLDDMAIMFIKVGTADSYMFELFRAELTEYSKAK